MSTSSSPVAGMALSLSPKSAGGVTDPPQANGAIGPNVAVESFTKVLSEQTAGAQGGISHGKTPLQDAKHPTDRVGRNKNQASKAADTKRSILEPLIGVPAAPVLEVPSNGKVRVPILASKGNGAVRQVGRAQPSMSVASPAQTNAKVAPAFVQPQSVDAASGGSLIGEVAGAAAAETTQVVSSSEISAVEASKPSVMAAASETSRVSAAQKVSDLSQRAAASTVSDAIGTAKASASEVPFGLRSGGAPNEMQISGNPLPVSQESLPTPAGVMDRSVSGGLVNSKLMPAESARPATSDRASRSSVASSAMSATASLNFLQVQKVESSTTISGSPVSGNSAASLDVKALSEAISRPLADGHGSHTIVVAMHPADLGQLEAVVSMDHTALQVSLAPQTQAGHLALAHAVDALKNQLAQNGMSVNVTLRDPGSQSGSQPRQYPNEPRRGPEVPNDRTVAPSSVSSFTTGQMHLVL